MVSLQDCLLFNYYCIKILLPSVECLTNSQLVLSEYCASRAVPSVSESQYLKHLGAELHPNIDIMWTGTISNQTRHNNSNKFVL